MTMLTNDDFEGTFREFNGIGELKVAEGWVPWYVEGNGYHRPEYGPESLAIGSGRVYQGTFAQKQATTFAKHDGGIYQQVSVEPGQWYEFSSRVYIWSSEENDPDVSERPGKYAALVGINPWGDARAMYRTTIWGKESIGDDGLLAYDQWMHVFVIAQAWTDKIVVFTRGEALFAAHHQDSYWDACHLRQVGIPGGEPTPTPEPGPGEVDYKRIRSVMRDELAQREPIRWPR
jgi:hypothetical protein